MDDVTVEVELNVQQLELLDALCAAEGYADRADALLAGLRGYLAANGTGAA